MGGEALIGSDSKTKHGGGCPATGRLFLLGHLAAAGLQVKPVGN